MPLLKVLVREKEGLSLLTLNEVSGVLQESVDTISKFPANSSQFSPDGTLLTAISGDKVQILESDSGNEKFSAELPGTVAVAISPGNAYLQVFQKSKQAAQGQSQDKNLTVRRIEGGEVVLQQFQKAFSKTAWPSIQFGEDQSAAARCFTNEVQLYNPNDWSQGISERIKVANLSCATLSHNPPSHLAVFVGESKGAPAGVRIFKRPLKPDSIPVARRSFFRATSCRLLWNTGSTAVLAWSQSDVDKTNQSYYGESNVHFLATDASFEGSVPLSKEGPIHDVQWSPSGKEFVVVYGFMPSKATLFDHRCKPLFDFGSGPRNMIRWSPHSRYICLAGFGNLPGDVEVWDRSSLSKLGSTRASNGVSLEWSPSGHLILVATTAPRLQVDNGIRVYTCDCSLVYSKPFSALFQAEWKPSGSFPEVLFVSGALKPIQQQQASSSAGITKSTDVPAKIKPAGAYRPPHSRSLAAPGNSNAKSQIASNAGKIKAQNAGSSGSVQVESKASLKKKEQEKKAAVVTQQLSELKPPSVEDSAVGDSAEVIAKKIRALLKKSRQIEELQKKKAEGGSLTPEQIEKVKTLPILLSEIAALEKLA